MASFQSAVALRWLALRKALKNPANAAGGFRRKHSTVLPLWGRFEARMAVGESSRRLHAASGWGPPTGRPGRSRVLLSRQACQRSPPAAATAGRHAPAELRAASIRAHRAGRTPDSARGRPPGRRDRRHTTTSTSLSLAARRLSVSPHRWASSPDCPMLSAMQAAEGCAGIRWPHGSAADHSKLAPAAGLMGSPSTRPGRRPRSPSGRMPGGHQQEGAG